EPLPPRHGAPAGAAPPEVDPRAGGRLRRQVVAAERQHLAGEVVDAERPLPRPGLVEQPPIGGQALVWREPGLHDQVESGRHGGERAGAGAPAATTGAYHVRRCPTTNAPAGGGLLPPEQPGDEVGERQRPLGVRLPGKRGGEGGVRVVVTGNERGDRRPVT